jgi:hypothetical protein
MLSSWEQRSSDKNVHIQGVEVHGFFNVGEIGW